MTASLPSRVPAPRRLRLPDLVLVGAGGYDPAARAALSALGVAASASPRSWPCWASRPPARPTCWPS